jgi:hypothetical protein
MTFGNVSASGITFPATQSASGNANTLDDYEEGTYTATLTCQTSGTITLGAQTLSYTKTGRLVTISGYLTVASVASPVGQIHLNLPITISNSLPAQTGGLFLGNALASGNVLNYWMYTDTQNSRASIFLGGGTSVSTAAAQTVQADSEFRVFLSYITD